MEDAMGIEQVGQDMPQRVRTRGRYATPPSCRWQVPGLFLVLLTLATGCTAITPRHLQVPDTWTVGRVFEHVLIIVLENQDYETVRKHPYMKYLGAQGSLFAQFYGLFHPSYPNYLAMVGGKFFGTIGDVQKDIDAKTIADLLEAKQLTWKQYAEGLPGPCFTGSLYGSYARKHGPFISFISIQHAPERCAHVVDERAFDPHHLPHYAFYSPDMIHDGHDTSLDTAAAWLKGFLAPLLADSSIMDTTLIVVTFDESASQGVQDDNHIYTVFLGNMVKQAYVEERPYDHYNVLRTIEENFGLGTLGAQDAASFPIVHVWSK
jgi:hypothetical protein